MISPNICATNSFPFNLPHRSPGATTQLSKTTKISIFCPNDLRPRFYFKYGFLRFFSEEILGETKNKQKILPRKKLSFLKI